MQRRWLRICALLCLAVCSGQGARLEAGKLALARRQDASPEDNASTITPTPTSGGDRDQETTAAVRESSETPGSSGTPVEVSTTGEVPSPTSSSSPTTAPSAINGNDPENSTETACESNSPVISRVKCHWDF